MHYWVKERLERGLHQRRPHRPVTGLAHIRSGAGVILHGTQVSDASSRMEKSSMSLFRPASQGPELQAPSHGLILKKSKPNTFGRIRMSRLRSCLVGVVCQSLVGELSTGRFALFFRLLIDFAEVRRKISIRPSTEAVLETTSMSARTDSAENNNGSQTM